MEKYCLNLPYPEVSGKITQASLGLLMEALGGRVSECTLEHSYKYAYFMALGELREVFRQIICCKQIHLERLAEAIISFGGLPLFSGEKTFWSGSYVEYSVGKSCIANLIRLVEGVLTSYEEIINEEHNPSLKKLVTRLIMDSRLHITTLNGFLDGVYKK